MLLELDHDFFSNFTEAAGRKIFHEDIQNHSTLLVTIGDSWTWGDSLYGIKGIKTASDRLDDPRRLTAIYGYHLKNLIKDCDWINIAYPGTANRWIVDSAWRFLNISKKLKYQRIIISVGLTDIGRDLNQRGFNRTESFVQAAINYEKNYLESLCSIDSHPKFSLVVGRNFTSTFPENLKIIKHHLVKRWIDISADNWPDGFRPPECSIFHLPEDITYEDKQWALTNLIPNSEKAIEFLDLCPLHYKMASKHPTEECHKLWSNYVFDYLQKNCLL